MTTQQPEALRLADELCEAIAEYPEPTALEAQAAAELHRQHARITELEDACRTNIENYELQRSKADRATATVYQFHYAMKDAGWHPGRTDDDLTQISEPKAVSWLRPHGTSQSLSRSLHSALTRQTWLRPVHRGLGMAWPPSQQTQGSRATPLTATLL